MPNEFLDKFRRARNAGTPLFAISSFDPEATMSSIQVRLLADKENGSIPIICWDIIRGWRYRNEAGKQTIAQILADDDIDQTLNAVYNLELALALPERSILFMMNAQHYLEKPEFMQALWNLRDEFKTDGRSVVLLGPDFVLPAQLQQDVFVLDEPLPTEVELKRIVSDLIETSELEVEEAVQIAAVDALRGLSAFPAEQSVAMNLSKKGLDVGGLWERKRKLISSTPGLRIYDGKEKFEDIGGCDQIKKFMAGIINGKDAPRVIVFIDEGEKMFAGSTGSVSDSSGVSQDYLATTLSYMEDNECDGSIFIGPPGAAKSAIAKATGNEAGIPTIVLDLGEMKGGLVGKSEAQLRNAFKVITAVGGGRAFFIMTCNKIVDLPPELKRRFTSGTFFFDLPTKEERNIIWPIYIDKYDLNAIELFEVDDEGWTGAEIRNCCRLDYRQNIGLHEAAKYIIPVSKSAKSEIKRLRQQASGAYLSANASGVYQWEDQNDPLNATTVETTKRRLNMEE